MSSSAAGAPPDSQDLPSPAAACGTATAPTLSVVVPVRNSPAQLEACLKHLHASGYTSFELIVVDDASTDASPEVARQLGARVVQMPQRCGPAGARNAGAAQARGRYLLFVDADVCVHPGTLAAVAACFEADQGLAALFGSYDDRPTARNLLSQYKNLFHHFTHQQGLPEATTFWAGCGAVRRDVFTAIGGFDTRYDRPSIEDIELGARLWRAGYCIRLCPEIQAAHLKRWSLFSMIRSDVCDRALPWTRLIVRERHLPNDLNLKYSQRISALAACGLAMLLFAGAWFAPWLLAAAAAGVGALMLLDYLSDHGLSPLVCQALLAVGLAAAGWGAMRQFGWWMAVPLGLIGLVVVLNIKLYRFFAQRRGLLFAIFSCPLHLLYYVYSVAAFAVGVVLARFAGRAKPHASQQPGAER